MVRLSELPRPARNEGVNVLPGRQSVACLPPILFGKLRPLMTPREFTRDSVLYRQEDRVASVFFPDTAVISEFQTLADGRTIEIALTGIEGVVGIESIGNDCTAANAAVVSVAGTGFSMSCERLEREIGFSRPLQRWHLGLVNTHIKHISSRVICNTHHGVEERFCTWLLMLSDRTGQLSFCLTQEFIAGVLGIYRPNLTTMARSIRDRGAIDYSRGHMHIVDKSMLSELSCTCYTAVSMH